ncbi:RsmE family RNA methyltransferase [Lacticaseibacillus absianus]|uniref:RsmE family RNA methyltransferase n=1 Tax=Lacticaseibacillus absianus TaxID=2729623 RepID=UPI0015C78382|nr:16S rRNA (uracil(1498)-N(3))-methyltransferase [Lacticaseibacillus absianus]
MNRFFTQQPLAVGQAVTLSPEIAKHAVRVLRLDVGAAVELVDPNAQVFVATIEATAPLRVVVASTVATRSELPIAVQICCGVPKGDKAELIVQKATELGVQRVSFYNSQWATAKWQAPKADKKLARLQLIAQGAAEQSHRAHIPVVELVSFQAILAAKADSKLIAYEKSAKIGETSALVQAVTQRPQTLVAVFGPEGGISPAEITALTAAGFTAAGLGPRILRTETAPLYLLSAISTLTELQGENN